MYIIIYCSYNEKYTLSYRLITVHGLVNCYQVLQRHCLIKLQTRHVEVLAL